MDDTLANLRKEIDAIDRELLALLAKRFATVKTIGEYKKQHGIQALDAKRWEEVLTDKKKRAVELGLPEELIEKLYTIIHEHALFIEKEQV